MKRFFFVSVFFFYIVVWLARCSSNTPIIVNTTSENVNGTNFGVSALIEIGNGLYYDSTTRIVYLWNGYWEATYDCITPSPYYAPNGLPYRYNPETNTFEEIEE